MAEESEKRRETLLDWIQGLGLPIASLLASAAFFMLQMQQQAFETELASVKDGYHFYLDHRIDLNKRTAVEEADSLLSMIQTAYPAVYCDVRKDLQRRVAIADTSDDPGAFSGQDRDQLMAELDDQDMPAVSQNPPAWNFAFWQKSQQPGPCKAAPIPTAAAKSTAPAAPTQMVDVAPPAPIAAAKLKPGFAREMIARRIALAPSQGLIRVFFHITDSGARDINVADPFRDELGALNYRVMRGVERVPASQFPSKPEVRYFGPDQAQDAAQLAAFLTAHFASENLVFGAKQIGALFPNMPPGNVEVWVPDAKPAP